MKTLRFALLAGLITGCHIDQLFTAARSGSGSGSTGLVFMSQPHDVAAGVAMNPVVQVQAVDGAGNPLTTFAGAVTIAIGTNPSGGVLKTTVTSATPVNGIATFADVKLDKAGSGYTLTAAAPGARTDTSTGFAVTPGAATQLSFTVQPATAPTGVAIQPPIQVTAYDLFLNKVTSFTGAIKVALGQNPKAARLSGTTSVSASGGVATFTNLSLDQVGTGYTLIASSVGGTPLSIESAKFNITSTHKAPSQLAFVTQPATTQAGTTITPPVGVAALDSAGNTVATDSTSVSVAFGANPGSATLSGTRTVTTTSGFAFFADLSVSKPASGYTLTATSTGLTSATSTAFTVTPVPVVATTLVFLVQPHATQAGSAIAPPVQVVATNNAGSTATTYTGLVTIALGAIPGGATLSGTLTTNAVGGVATFSNLSVNKVGVGYTLTATASLLAGALSATFDITPPAKKLAFLAQPHTTQAGSAISPAVQVVAQDSTGIPTAGYTGLVTIGFGVSLPGAVLGGTLTVSAASGVATFSNLTVSKAGTGYTLVATSGALTAATSAAFDVTAPPQVAKTLAFTVQPANTRAGIVIAPALQVTARDSLGIAVTSYTGSITIALSGGSGGTLSGTRTVSAVNGVATFSTLSVDQVGVGYTLTAAATGLTGASSNLFNVTP